ncbi:MAG: 2-deoxy-D-gluconate 3-dehydrogenase [Planctomycetaceae bacterium]|nr:2-deoxy-D-gluconate 3-dehydrogenase [Planctomycetaceae bacterium]
MKKTVLITGGTSGIGLGISLGFQAAGYQVIATGVSAGETEATGNLYPDLDCRVLDVTSQEQITTTLNDLQHLDVLINCAGVILRDNQEHTAEGFEKAINVNLHGTMRMCYAAKQLLTASQGCIINTASMLSFFGSGYVPAYSASKGGVVQFTKSLAIAWAEDQIRVNAIAPGWIKTALTTPLYEDQDRSKEITNRTPLKRWGLPEDVAGPTLFLASDQAKFVTGVILPVDGGYSIM